MILQVLTKSKKVRPFVLLIAILLLPVLLVWKILKTIVRITGQLFFRINSSIKRELIPITSRISEFYTPLGFPSKLTKRKGKKFRRELQNFLKKSGEQPSLVFCGTITAIEILELSNLFSYKQNSPQIVVVVRREPAEENLSQQFWRLLGKSFDPNVIKLFADTAPLSTLWSDCLEYPVQVLPIPTWSDKDFNASANESSLGLTYLGDARDEKNFSDLVALVPLLIAKNEALFSQVNYSLSSRLSVQSARNDLMNRSDSLITAKNHPLDSVAYREAILNSGIVYVNYDANNYSYRSSGIFVEALMAEKPVIVSDGSWMHFELSKLSRIFWEESVKLNAETIHIRDALHLKSMNLLSFTSKPDAKIAFEVRLNTGIVLNSTSWTDVVGKGYLPIPNLNDSEYVEHLATTDRNLSLQNLTISKFSDQEPKYLGGVVAELGRSPLALAEFYRAPSAYINSCHHGITSFHKFHSMSNLKELILKDFKS